ncbi:MAG: UDP-2,3-diacylglucosamine diphosphatase [Bacteroidota bacterium]
MKETQRRKVDILVLSDIHLGTYGCHAKELCRYLKSIKPKTVILNGDIIDIWQFSKSYWPKSHMKVVKQLMNWMSKGTRIYYITGNHDEMLRKFEGFKMGSFSIVNKVVLEIANGETAWFFHGDVFDVTMQHSKWLAKLGAIGYDTLIVVNRLVNFISERIFKKGKLSLSKKIKDSVKGAISFINNFEQTAAEIGISNQYDYVICGHIHQHVMREIANENGKIQYLNSGDWVENLSALEYTEGKWSLYKYRDQVHPETDDSDEDASLDTAYLFDTMLREFNSLKKV